MKIAIGTAQVGLRYGVANTSGRMGVFAASRILSSARTEGVDLIDTAIAYGESEKVLGELGVRDFKIVSKLPRFPDDVCGKEVSGWVRSQLLASLKRLRVKSLYGLLLHSPTQLSERWGDYLYDGLCQAQECGLVKKIGVSIYSPADLDDIWPKFRLDIVQSPFNVLDRRLFSSGLLHNLCSLGVECHARSVFLQGLLVLNPEERPARFSKWGKLLSEYDRWVTSTGLNRQAVCLRVAMTPDLIDRVVVGVDSAEQFEEIVALASTAEPLEAPDFGVNDSDLLHPGRWGAE
jgi:aryl-alcohol dehydrogenase-like predicted oxidoreductase